MLYSELIKDIRIKSLLSQSNFAKELGASFSTVNRWENGKAVPKIYTLRLICEFCHTHNIPFEIDTKMETKENNLIRTEK